MQTITIDGKEYVLVPKEDLQPINPQRSISTSLEPQESLLNDFIPESSTSLPFKSKPLEIATIEEQREAIRVVDATNINEVPKASPKEYEYRKRFVEKNLTTQDIRNLSRPNSGLIRNFSEIPEIKALDAGRTPSTSTGPSFYGPGVEFDIV